MALPATIQSRSTYDTSSLATLQLAYTSALGAGHLLIAACIWGSGSQTCTVASTNNGSWTAIGSPQRGTGNLTGYTIQTYYKLSCAAGADTVTMTCSGSNAYRSIAIHEVSGIDVSTALEASVYSGNVTASSNVITTASGITTTNPVDYCFCAAMVDNQVSSAGSPYTLDENLDFGGNGTEHHDRFATGTYTASFNVTSTTDASMILVAFKQTAPTLPTPNNIVITQSYNGGTGPHTASAGSPLDLSTYGNIEIDTLSIQPNVICYFEAVAKTSVSLQNQIILEGGEQGTGPILDLAGIEIPSGTTSYTFFRSPAFTLPLGDKLDYAPIIGAGVGGTTTLLAWRIIIIQGSGSQNLTTTETQIEIGNYETGTNSTLGPLAKPKYWTYKADRWDGQRRYFVSAKIGGSGGTVVCKLQQDDGSWGNWTDFLTVYSGTLSGYSWPIIMFSSDPTDGRHYRLAMSTSSGTWTCYNVKILVDQYEGGTLFGVGFYDSPFPIQGGTSGSGETNQAQAEAFKITNTSTLTGVRIGLKKTGLPTDNLSFDIVSTLGGSSLANGTLAASSVTGIWAIYDITFGTPFSPTLNTTYYVQITRSGARDAAKYVSAEGDTTFDDSIGQAYGRSNNSWGAENYDISFQLLGAAGIQKLEPHLLLLNTGNTGTGLQNMLGKVLTAGWSGVTATPYYSHDASNVNDASKLVVPPSTDITNATVSGANHQIAANAFTWPADGSLLDVNVTAATGIVSAGRIIVAVAVANAIEEAVSLVYSLSITQPQTQVINESVDLAAFLGISEAGQCAVQDALSLGRSAGQGGAELAAVNDAASLADSRTLASSSQANENEAISLTRQAGATAEGGPVYKDGTTLFRAAGVSAEGNRATDETAALGRAAGITSAEQASISNSIILARAAGQEAVTLATVQDALSLSRSAGLAADGQKTGAIEETVSLARWAGLASSTQAQTGEMVSLAIYTGFTASTLNTIDESVSLAWAGGLSGAVLREVAESIALDESLLITPASQASADDGVSLAYLAGISVATLVNIQDALSLSYLATLAASAQLEGTVEETVSLAIQAGITTLEEKVLIESIIFEMVTRQIGFSMDKREIKFSQRQAEIRVEAK